MSALRRNMTEDNLGEIAEVIEVPTVVEDAPSEAAPIVLEELAAPTALSGFRRVVAFLIVADTLAILSALLVVHTAESDVPGLTGDLVLVMLAAPLVWVAVFHSFGLYGVKHLSAPEEFRRLISATTIAVVLIMVGSVWWEEALGRRSLALTWFVALVLELAVRRLARWHVGEQRRMGKLALRTLIVGTNQEAATIAEALSLPVRGFMPVGFLTAPGSSVVPRAVPVLGSVDELLDTIQDTSAECVFVASTAVSAADVYRISRACRQTNIEMRLSANTQEMLTSRVSIHQVHDLMVLAVRSAKLTETQAVVKRSFDLVLSSIAFLALSPLMGAVALAIKLSSSGPVLFRQERVTKDGRTFTVYKFRTMITDPQRALEGHVIDITQPFFKMRDDPRLTRVGRLLRSTSLDELPQLWNVIRGDMSLVGPRPLAAEQVAANVELLEARHEVRAGLTGWWQINGRSEVSVEEALKMDLFYIENWSLTLDLYVLLKTIGVVVARRGAF
jgi:exopolysaccharide biosynthesis polyprenyl glycosylphosphotransferase